MDSTRITLLDRVRNAEDALAWEEFYQLYSGIIYGYACQRGLNDTDALELVSDCMEALARQMAEFEYQPQRCKFRSFLRAMVHHKVAEIFRRKKAKSVEPAELDLVKSSESSAEQIWESQWETRHLMFCWSILEKEVPPMYAEAFRMVVINQIPIPETARILSITPNHVYQIKSRMSKRLKEIMQGIDRE